MTEDYTQEMKFWFGNRYGDESDLGQVHLERGADYLPNVMEAFERFLRQAGFTYIELLTDGESWQFIKGRDYEEEHLDRLREEIFEDAGWDNYFEELGDAAEQAYDADEGDFETMTDEEFDQKFAELDAEAAAYEAERTYDEEYYDPFTRDVDWDKVLPWEPEPSIAVGDKVRVVAADIGDSKCVFGREGTVDLIVEDTDGIIHAGQTVLVKFPPPAISAGSFETSFWWINPDALEVIG